MTSNRAERIAQQPQRARDVAARQHEAVPAAHEAVDDVVQHAAQPGKLSKVRSSRNSSSRNVAGSLAGVLARPRNPSVVSNAVRAPGAGDDASTTGKGETAVTARRKRSGVVAVRSTSMHWTEVAGRGVRAVAAARSFVRCRDPPRRTGIGTARRRVPRRCGVTERYAESTFAILTHRNSQAFSLRSRNRGRIAGVGVPHHANPRIAGQDAFELFVRVGRAIGRRSPSPRATSSRLPTPPPWWTDTHVGAARRIQQRIQDGPIGNRVAAVEHPFGLPVRRRHRAGIEMVAADDDRRPDLAFADELVDAQAERARLAVAEPQNACGQPLERHARAREVNQRTRASSCPNISSAASSVTRMSSGSPESATQRNGTLAFAKERPDVLPARSREYRRRWRPPPVSPARGCCCRNRGDRAVLPEREHRANVLGHRRHRSRDRTPWGCARAGRTASSNDMPLGTYPFSASCADVWSVSTSGMTPRAMSAGSTSAALARKAIDRPIPSRVQRATWPSATSRLSVASST